MSSVLKTATILIFLVAQNAFAQREPFPSTQINILTNNEIRIMRANQYCKITEVDPAAYPQLLLVSARDRSISGTAILLPNGQILTAKHIVRAAQENPILLSNIKKGFPQFLSQGDVQISGRGMSKTADWALLKLRSQYEKEIPYLPLVTPDKIQVDQPVYVLGYPTICHTNKNQSVFLHGVEGRLIKSNLLSKLMGGGLFKLKLPWIEQGFSGGAVLQKDKHGQWGIIGMQQSGYFIINNPMDEQMADFITIDKLPN